MQIWDSNWTRPRIRVLVDGQNADRLIACDQVVTVNVGKLDIKKVGHSSFNHAELCVGDWREGERCADLTGLDGDAVRGAFDVFAV